jgi:hypothetical protein
MKIFVLIFFVGISLYFYSGCKAPDRIPGSGHDSPVKLVIGPGEHWQEKMKAGIFTVKKTPQMAAWLEDVNGQPSLVYHARFTAGQPFRIPLVPIGHGQVDGSGGNITGELESITSALRIVKDVYIMGE